MIDRREWEGKVHVGDCLEIMRGWEDGCAQLCVTSPPYNAGMDYGEGIDDEIPWERYWSWARDWLHSVYEVLCVGGRLCLNVPAVMWRSPSEPVAARYHVIASDSGFLTRGEIVWDKGPSRRGSCAWGSWLSHANPSLRDGHEMILVFSKVSYDLPNPRAERADLEPQDFMRDTYSIWRINPERARDHPAPFPVALAGRLIKLYSWPGDLVIDPFAGSGSTGVAAANLGRSFLGCEISEEYVALAEARIAREREKLQLPLGATQ